MDEMADGCKRQSATPLRGREIIMNIDTRLDGRNNLNSRRTVPNDCYSFIGIIQLLRPVRTVYEISLEVVEALDLWPFPMA